MSVIVRRIRGRPHAEDSGTIMLLTVGYTLVALAFLLAVVDVSKVFLVRRSLASACDGAALRAAQEASPSAVYSGDTGGLLPLDGSQVSAVASQYGRDVYAGVPEVTFAARAVGTAAVVDCQQNIALPFTGFLDLPRYTVRAHAEANAPLLSP